MTTCIVWSQVCFFFSFFLFANNICYFFRYIQHGITLAHQQMTTTSVSTVSMATSPPDNDNDRPMEGTSTAAKTTPPNHPLPCHKCKTEGTPTNTCLHCCEPLLIGWICGCQVAIMARARRCTSPPTTRFGIGHHHHPLPCSKSEWGVCLFGFRQQRLPPHPHLLQK